MHQRGGRTGRLRDLDRLAGPVLAASKSGIQHDALRAEAVRHRQLRARPETLETLDGQGVLALDSGGSPSSQMKRPSQIRALAPRGRRRPTRGGDRLFLELVA